MQVLVFHLLVFPGSDGDRAHDTTSAEHNHHVMSCVPFQQPPYLSSKESKRRNHEVHDEVVDSLRFGFL